MPIGFLDNAERERLSQFPPDISNDEVIAYFTLTKSDRGIVPKTSSAANRLGVGVQIGTLRYLGFSPKVARTPMPVVEYVAAQLGVPAAALKDYGGRRVTVAEHLAQVQEHLGFRRVSSTDAKELTAWLIERALEHDRPTLLLSLACDRLRMSKIVRPALNRIERVVARARRGARLETFRRLAPLLTPERRAKLDALVVADEGRTPLAWLREDATKSSPKSITETLDKLRFLIPRVAGVDLGMLTPNHRKALAEIGYRSSNQALARMPEERRYPVLLAFLLRAHEEVTDETIEMFERCLAGTYARAERDLDDARLKAASSTEEKVRLLHEVLGLVVDRSIADKDLRKRIFDHLTEEALLDALADCEELVRPEDGGHLELLGDRYAYLRQFAPAFVAAFEFQSHQPGDPLLAALDVLRELNATGRRGVPEDAPVSFVPAKWLPYIVDDEGRIERKYYELCVLWALRGALRGGDVWLAGSRRYADPESYLIPQERWPSMRAEVSTQLGALTIGPERLDARCLELEVLLKRVDGLLPRYGRVRIENGELIVPRSPAEQRPASLDELERLVAARLPLVELSDLLLEVDGWTGFSKELRHAAGSQPRSKELLVHSHASILAQACNLGLTRMAHVADLSYEKLSWCTTWYLREETLGAAVVRIVNYQHRQPLARRLGTGAFSSSDGQRWVMPVPSRTATAVRPYFGYGRGVAASTWTSDQFSQYGAKPSVASMREATYVLDGILDNQTELKITEHTTDTAGYTDIVFAIFDLLGVQFMPRLRHVGGTCLYRIDRSTKYPNLDFLLRGTVNPPKILKHWDAMFRVVGSLKLGWVSASLFLTKLQRPQKNALATALEEYGRLNRTIFLLRYIEDETMRKRIGSQLNKGEAVHALKRFLVIANQGQLRCSSYEEQVNQIACLNLVSNAVIAWNTTYMHVVLEQLRAEGHVVLDADVAHLSPARYEHINPHGRYTFDVARARPGGALRPLRRP